MHFSFQNWLFLAAFLTPVFAQQTPLTNSPNRISLDVVVNDKAGNPVSGLQQRDFTVLDNKQPQKLISFEAVSQARSASIGPEIILVVDIVNTSFGRVAFEREQIKKFLQQDGERLAFPVSLFFFSDTGLNRGGPASRDGNAVAAYLDRNAPGLRTDRPSQGYYGAVDRSQLSLRAIAQLAAYEEKRPGRKIAVWISPGWPLLSGPNTELSAKERQSVFDTIAATANGLMKAGITLYSVDPLGTDDSGSFRTFYYEEFLKAVPSPKQAQIGNLALQVLAVHSGGRVFNSNNNVAGEIERCVRDATGYYVLSFAAHPADGPNEYHSLEIKLPNSGLRPQSLTGYYAEPKE